MASKALSIEASLRLADGRLAWLYPSSQSPEGGRENGSIMASQRTHPKAINNKRIRHSDCYSLGSKQNFLLYG